MNHRIRPVYGRWRWGCISYLIVLLIYVSKVNGTYDGAVGVTFDENGKSTNPFGDDEDDELMDQFIRDTTKHSAVTDYNNYSLTSLRDSGSYYVLVGNGVCPAVATNLVSIDVMKQLPNNTAITPHPWWSERCVREGSPCIYLQIVMVKRYMRVVMDGMAITGRSSSWPWSLLLWSGDEEQGYPQGICRGGQD